MKLKIILGFILFYHGAYCHGSELIFIPNKGQWDSNVKYKADIKQGAIFLEQRAITVHLRESNNFHFQSHIEGKPFKGHSYRIELVNSNSFAEILSYDKTNEYFNYFIGSDTSKWKSLVSGYEVILYKNIYPSIDLRIESKDFQPKYTFVLHKGADHRQIKMKFIGLDSLLQNSNGDLISYTSMGEIKDERPLSYILRSDVRKELHSAFELRDQTVQFQLDPYNLNPSEVLEIDPQIIFSSYSGSTADNFGASATYDYAGNLYGTGLVFGVGYPTTTGAYSSVFGGSSDIAITKFNQTGSSRVYSTYIGGSSYDVPHSLVVDRNDRLILLATTSSSNYPVTGGAFQTSFLGGPGITSGACLTGLGVFYPNGSDIAITKFNASGSALIGSSFFGGSGTDGIGGNCGQLIKNYGDAVRGEVETDTFGNIYIASLSNSTNLPSLSASPFSSNSGGYDGILVKFNTNLTNLLGFSYYGGSGDDAFYDLCFDKSGNIYATGGTTSSNLSSVASNAINPTYSGNVDGMISSFNGNISSHRVASYIGTSDYDQSYFVECDSKDSIYVYGQTNHSASNYFIVNAGFSNPHKGQFITKLGPNLNIKTRSTTFGAGNQNPDISPTAFLVDYCDKIFITGWGSNLGGFNTFTLTTTGLPVTANAFQANTQGAGFYLMILEGDMSAQYYGTFFGGTTAASEEHVDGGTSRFDKNGIVYHAVCAGCRGQQNFPIYPNAASVAGPTNNSSNCNLGVFKFDFGLPVNADFSSNSVCAPGQISFTNLSHQVSTNTQWRWLFSNGVTSTLKDPVVSFTLPGVYSARLIIIDSSSCNIADTIIKNVIVLGTTADTLTTKRICPGSSTRIGFSNLLDTGLTIRWNPTNTLDDSTILSPFASPTITTNYRLILSRLGCIDTFYQTVIVDTPPVMDIVGPRLFCAGAVAKYTTNKFAQGNYDWGPKNLLTSSNRDTAIFSFSSFPAILSVTYTNATGCISSDTILVSQGTPNISISADTIVCPGDVVTIVLSKNIQGGTISVFPSTMPIISIGQDTIRVRIDTSTKLFVDYNISANCKASDTLNFKILKDIAAWSVDSIVCFNAPVLVNNISAHNFNITWTPSALVSSGQGTNNASFNLNNKDTFVGVRFEIPGKSYCPFADSARVRFLEHMVKLRADTIACRDSIVTIRTASKLLPGSYTWLPLSHLVSSTDSSARFRVEGTKKYYLNVLDNNGCSASDSIQIRDVTSEVKLTADSIVCAGTLANIGTNALGGTSYTWLPGNLIVQGANTNQIKARVEESRFYYLHFQDTNGCYVIDSIFVKTFDSTHYTKADFLSNTNCNNLPINFTNTSRHTSAAANYVWSFAGQGSSTAVNPSFSFSPSGLLDIRLIVNDTNKCNKSDTIIKKILVLKNGTSLLPPLKACLNDTMSIGLTGMSDPTASISWTPSSRMLNVNSFSPRVFPLITTSYTGYISKNGCTDTVIQLLEIDTPSSVKLTGDTITCQNGHIIFKATKYNIGNYQWFPQNNIVSQFRDTAKMLINSNNMWVKVLFRTDFGCNSYDSLRIRIAPTTLSVQMDSIGCKDEILNINYAGFPNGGLYSFNPNANIITASNSTASIKIDTTRIITVQYSINNICNASKSIPFRILKDAVQWTFDSFTCKNQTITTSVLQNGRYSILWGPSSLLQTPQGQANAVFGSFNQSSKIWIQTVLQNRPSCQYRDTTLVQILEDYVKMKTDPVRCRDSFGTITVPFIPGATYAWRPISQLVNQNRNTAVFRVDTTRFFFVEVNYANKCSVKDSILIKIADDNLSITGDSVVCKNDNAILTATNLPKAIYQWSNGMSTFQISVPTSSTTIYRLSVTDSNNCVLKSSFEVKTFDTSNFKWVNPNTKNCKFDTVKLAMPYFAGVTYQWAPNSVILEGQGTQKIKAFITENTTFSVLGSFNKPGGLSCSIFDTIRIQKDTQYLKIVGKNLVCRGDTVTIIANNNTSFTYNWSLPSQVNQNGPIAYYKLTDSVQVKCEASSSSFSLCEYKDSIKIDVSRDLDNMVVRADPQRIEYGQSSQLSASATSIAGYFWSPRATLDNHLIPSPIAKPLTTTTYYVQVRNPLGCRSGDSVVVTVFYEDCKEPEIYLPTGFTPNGDNKNDILYVRGDNIEKMFLQIYDRWGQLMFSTENPKKGWDGIYNGAVLEPSVFAYHLWVQCIGGATYEKKGNITLIK